MLEAFRIDPVRLFSKGGNEHVSRFNHQGPTRVLARLQLSYEILPTPGD